MEWAKAPARKPRNQTGIQSAHSVLLSGLQECLAQVSYHAAVHMRTEATHSGVTGGGGAELAHTSDPGPQETEEEDDKLEFGMRPRIPSSASYVSRPNLHTYVPQFLHLQNGSRK